MVRAIAMLRSPSVNTPRAGSSQGGDEHGFEILVVVEDRARGDTVTILPASGVTV